MIQSIVVSIVALFLVQTGCSSRQQADRSPNLAHDDKVVMEVDPANLSNVLITIIFRNPVPATKKGVAINYHSAFMQRCIAGAKTNVFLTLSTGPTQGVSVCTFSIPENEVANCSVYLAGVTDEPVGEAEVAREVKLRDPKQISRPGLDPSRVNVQ